MQLTLEQYGFELGKSIYMQIFFNKYMYPTILYKGLKHLQILFYAGTPGTNPSGYPWGQYYVSVHVSSNKTVTVMFRNKVFGTKLKRNKGNDYNRSQGGDFLCGENGQGLGRGSAGSAEFGGGHIDFTLGEIIEPHSFDFCAYIHDRSQP